MVAHNYNPAQGIGIIRHTWGSITTGTRAALIEQGFAQEPFPGDPGANKMSMRSVDPKGRRIRIKRKSGGRFEIWRDWGADEERERLEAKRQAIEARDRHEAEKLVAGWPKSGSAYRERTVEFGDILLNVLERTISSGARGGYRYDDDAQLRFRILADQVRGLIESGTVVFDRQQREQATPEPLRGILPQVDAARRDKAFQEWLNTQGIEK